MMENELKQFHELNWNKMPSLGKFIMKYYGPSEIFTVESDNRQDAREQWNVIYGEKALWLNDEEIAVYGYQMTGQNLLKGI
jgi:hypothetical protein